MKLVHVVLCVMLAVTATLTTGCNREQKQTGVTSSPKSVEVAATPSVLATIAEKKPQAEPATSASGHGGVSGIVFSELGGGVAYLTENNGTFQVVHNGRAGKSYQEIDTNFVLSRDGRRVAYAAMIDGKWRMVVDGKEGRVFDTLGTPRISPDGKHVLYDAQQGDRWYIVVDDIVKGGCPSYFDKNFSSDSKHVVYIENIAGDDSMHRVVISDLKLNKLFERELRTENTVYSEDKSRMAVVAGVRDKKQLVVMSLDNPGTVNEGAFFDVIAFPAFGMDGKSVAYIAEKEGKRYLVLNGNEERLPDGEVGEPPAIRPDLKGAAVIMRTANGFYFHQTGGVDKTAAQRYEEAAFPSFNKSGNSYVYAARNGSRMFYVVNGKESPAFDKVLTPMFTPDGRKIVGRVRKDGKRFVVVVDENGQVVRQHPDHEMVFNPVFTADGKSVAYGVKDGVQLAWKVEKL